MTQRIHTLTPEERAQVLDIQDRLIELFVYRGEAVEAGNEHRAEALQGEIDDLMRQREAIEVSASGDGG